MLGFEYLKPDAPISPRDPEDTDPEGEGPDDGGPKGTAEGGRTQAARAAGGTRKPRAARSRSVGASLVPKVPLGTK